MTRDDAAFLAVAELAAGSLCLRCANAGQATVTLTHDELSEVALAFNRAVQLAIAAHLAYRREGCA